MPFLRIFYIDFSHTLICGAPYGAAMFFRIKKSGTAPICKSWRTTGLARVRQSVIALGARALGGAARAALGQARDQGSRAIGRRFSRPAHRRPLLFGGCGSRSVSPMFWGGLGPRLEFASSAPVGPLHGCSSRDRIAMRFLARDTISGRWLSSHYRARRRRRTGRAARETLAPRCVKESSRRSCSTSGAIC